MDDNIRQAQLTELAELASIGLHRGAVARLQDARGTRLRVETGAIWVTQQGSGDDAVVNAGDSFVIERDGKTLVMALGKRFALVSVEPPASTPVPPSPTWIERLDQFWCSLFAAHQPMRSYL